MGSKAGPALYRSGNRVVKMKWMLLVLAIVYALIPFDVLPDFWVGLGWLDDLLLAGLIWYLFFRKPAVSGRNEKADFQHDKRDSFQQSREEKTSDARATAAADPYSVLGVSQEASQEEIRTAYRRLAAQYHPDKLAHLGEEFQAMAEKKFKAIQAAYDELRIYR